MAGKSAQRHSRGARVTCPISRASVSNYLQWVRGLGAGANCAFKQYPRSDYPGTSHPRIDNSKIIRISHHPKSHHTRTIAAFNMPRVIPPATWHPITDPITAEWGITIKRTDYEKLLEGFSPRDMDDKWMCKTDKPDSEGNTTIHWYRSWGNMEVYNAVLEVIPNQTEDKDYAKFTKITWERKFAGLDVPPEEAKGDVANLCRGFVGCELENAGDTTRDDEE